MKTETKHQEQHDISTADQEKLLTFQHAKISYEYGAGLDADCENEHRYIQAMLSLEGLEDRHLRQLVADMIGGGTRAYEAETELFSLSLRIRKLFPNYSFDVN
jgi:hypothetical protein